MRLTKTPGTGSLHTGLTGFFYLTPAREWKSGIVSLVSDTVLKFESVSAKAVLIRSCLTSGLPSGIVEVTVIIPP